MDGIDDYIKQAAASVPDPGKEKIFQARDLIRTKFGQDIPDDVVNDFYNTTYLESGRSHYNRNGSVKMSPADPKDGQRAVGWSQIKPGTIAQYGLDPMDEQQNIAGGLKYFYDADPNDPVSRRIGYFSGHNSRSQKLYKTKGIIPKGGDFTGTSFQDYIAGTGGFKPVDDYIKSNGEINPNASGIDAYIQQTAKSLDTPQTAPPPTNPANVMPTPQAVLPAPAPTAPVATLGGTAQTPATPPTPVPETANTLQAQMASTIDANSPRSAVLLTNGNPVNDYILNSPEAKAMTRVDTPNGPLLVNAAKLKLQPSQVQDYVNQNGFAGLIGKAADVGNDTTQNPAVLTTDPKTGTELSASSVPTPEAAAQQAQIDQQAFPGSQTQIVSPQDVIDNRTNGNPFPPPVDASMAGSPEYQAYNEMADRSQAAGYPDGTAPLDNQAQRDKVLANAIPGEQPTDTIARLNSLGDPELQGQYLDFLKYGNQTDTPENRAEFNRIMQGTVDAANAENAKANATAKQEADAYNKKVAEINRRNQPATAATPTTDAPSKIVLDYSRKPANQTPKQFYDEQIAQQISAKYGLPIYETQQILNNEPLWYNEPGIDGLASDDVYKQAADAGGTITTTVDPSVIARIRKQVATNQQRADELAMNLASQKAADTGVNSPVAMEMLAQLSEGVANPADLRSQIGAEQSAYDEWMKAAGFDNEEYRKDHSQAFESERQAVIDNYGSFAALQQLKTANDRYYKDKPNTMIAGIVGLGGDDVARAAQAAGAYENKSYRLSNAEYDRSRSLGEEVKASEMGGAGGAPGVRAGLINSFGSSADFLAGLYRWSLPGLIEKGINAATGSDLDTANALNKFGEQARVVAGSAKGDGIIYDIGYFGGNLVGDSPRIMGMMMIPGVGPVVAFGLDSVLRNSHKPLYEQGPAAVKSMIVGGIFKGGNSLGQAVENGLMDRFFSEANLDALRKIKLAEGVESRGPAVSAAEWDAMHPIGSKMNTGIGFPNEGPLRYGSPSTAIGTPISPLSPNKDVFARLFVSQIAGESVKVGSIFGGTYLTARLEGQDERNAAYTAALNTITHLAFSYKKLGGVADLYNKAFRIAEPNGNYDFVVDGKGNVYDATGKVPDEAVQFVAPDREGFEVKGLLKGNVNEARGNRGNTIETTSEPKQLNAENPRRVETADPEAVNKAATDPTVQKVEAALTGEVQSVADIAAATGLTESETTDALLTLFGAKRIETLPDNRVRLLERDKAAEEAFNAAQQRNPGPLQTTGTGAESQAGDQQGTSTGEPINLGAGEGPPPETGKRIANPDPQLAVMAAIDTDARKVLTVLEHGQPHPRVDLAGKTGLNAKRFTKAIEMLYKAGLIEVLPNDRIRMIPESDRTVKTDIYDQFDENGRIVPPKADISQSTAPVVQGENVPQGTSDAAPAVPLNDARAAERTPEPTANIAAEYKGLTVDHPTSGDKLTFTGETNKNGNLLATNQFGRERTVSKRDADKWLAEQGGTAPATAPATVTHPNPAIDGQPILTTTPDGRSVVANPENKSGVSIVTDRSETPQTTTQPRPTTTKFRSLSQFVRANGGIRATKYDSGEHGRLGPKETNTTGIINRNSKFTAEQMAEKAWEAGYLRTEWPTIADRNGNDLMGYIEDDIASHKTSGQGRHYSQADIEAIQGDIAEQEAEYRRQQDNAEQAAADYAKQQDEMLTAQQRALADPEVQNLLEKLQEPGQYKTDSAIGAPLNEITAKYLDALERHGITDQYTPGELIDAYRHRKASANDAAGNAAPADEVQPQGNNGTGSESTAETAPVIPQRTSTVSTPSTPTPVTNPEPLTAAMRARVQYALDRKQIVSDIAQRYNLTEEQVRSVQPLQPVGSNGQISYKLRQNFLPQKVETDSGRAEKVAMVNDLAGELGLAEARVTRDTPNADIMNAFDLIRLTIARSFGHDRSSQMSRENWLDFLDARAGSLAEPTVAGMIDALEHQAAWNLKAEPFVNDKGLAQVLEDIDAKYGLANVADFPSLDKEFRARINAIGESYGLKRHAIQKLFSDTFLDFAQEEHGQTGDGRTGQEVSNPVTPQETGGGEPQEQPRDQEVAVAGTGSPIGQTHQTQATATEAKVAPPAPEDSDILFSNAFDQTDLFGNPVTPQVSQGSLPFAAPTFTDSGRVKDMEQAYGKPTADYIDSLTNSEDPKLYRTAIKLSDARFMVMQKGEAARQIVEDAADALDTFALARQTQSPVEAILAQQNLDGSGAVADNISPRAAEFAKAMETGAFSREFERALSEAKTDPDVQFMTAWHGSPHRFEKFDISKIGTGEGAQAYGHGLYFAGNEEVADFYKKKLTYGGDRIIDKNGNPVSEEQNISQPLGRAQYLFKDSKGDVGKAIERIKTENWNGSIYSLGTKGDQYIPKEDAVITELRRMERDGYTYRGVGGKYRVDLKPPEGSYLLWDKPLSEQSAFVKKALADAYKERSDTVKGLRDNVHKSDWYGMQADYLQRQVDALKPVPPDFDTYFRTNGGYAGVLSEENLRKMYEEEAANRDKQGSEIYRALDKAFGSSESASDYLKSLGIRGIKYLDGSSRGPTNWYSRVIVVKDGDRYRFDTPQGYKFFDTKAAADAELAKRKDSGSYNYVIFDDKDVEIEDIQFAKPDPADQRAEHRELRRNAQEARAMSDTALTAAAKFSVNPQTRTLELNVPALLVFTRAVRAIPGQQDSSFTGITFNHRSTPKIQAVFDNAVNVLNATGQPRQAARVQAMADAVRAATDPQYGDLIAVLADPSLPLAHRHATQEEMTHRADNRIKALHDTTFDQAPFIGLRAYATAQKHLIEVEGYPISAVHREIIGKLNRNDATDALGISQQELYELQDIRDAQLLAAGVSQPEYLDAYGDISDTAMRRAQNYGRTNQTVIDGRATGSNAGGSPEGGSQAESAGALRTAGSGRLSQDAGGPDAAGIRPGGVSPTGESGDVIGSRIGVKPVQTETPAFKRWFKDSKVVDANGQPLVVYHGAGGDFDVFDPAAEGVDGIFFSSRPKIASVYAKWRPNGSVMPVYLSLQNPLIVDYLREFDAERFQDAIDEAKLRKRDGVIFRNVRDGWTTNDPEADTYVVFRSNQIKSAIGNNGNFDPNEDSILLARNTVTRKVFDKVDKLFQTDSALSTTKALENIVNKGMQQLKAADEDAYEQVLKLAGTQVQATLAAVNNPDIAPDFYSELKRHNLENVRITLELAGLAQPVTPGTDLSVMPKIMGKPSTTMHIGDKLYIVPKWLSTELRPALDKPQDANLVQKVMDKLDVYGMSGPLDLFYHGTNIIATVIGGTPYAGTDILSRTIGNTPVTKWLTTVINIWRSDPANVDPSVLRDMAEAGVLSSRYAKTTYSANLAARSPLTEKVSILPFKDGAIPDLSPILNGPKGLDIRARILLWQIGKHMNPNASVTDMADFVNQAGIYNNMLQSQMVRFLKNSRIGRFAVAGTTMSKNGLLMWLNKSPLPSEDLPFVSRTWLRTQQQLGGGPLGVAVLLWLGASLLYRGMFPWKDPESRFMQIPLNPKERNSPFVRKIAGDTGSVYVNLGFFSPLLERGARGLGISGAYNEVILGGNSTQMAEAGMTDVMNTALHPIASSPTTKAVFVAATGKEMQIKSLRKDGESNLQMWETPIPKDSGVGRKAFEGALDLNPFVGNIFHTFGVNRDPAKPSQLAKDELGFILRTTTDIALPRLVKGPSDRSKARAAIQRERRLIEYPRRRQ